jgi:hypothetical protein
MPNSPSLSPRDKRGKNSTPLASRHRPDSRPSAVRRQSQTQLGFARNARRRKADTHSLPELRRTIRNSNPLNSVICTTGLDRIVRESPENRSMKCNIKMVKKKQKYPSSVEMNLNTATWGKKKLLLDRMPSRENNTRKSTFRKIPQHGRKKNTVSATAHAFTDVSSTNQETPTKGDEENLFFGSESGSSSPAYMYEHAGLNGTSTASFFHELYPTPQKRLLEEPLMSLSPPLSSMDGCDVIAPSCGIQRRMVSAHWNSTGSVGISMRFPSEELLREQHGVRIAFPGRPTNISPLRAFPTEFSRNANVCPLSATASSMRYKTSASSGCGNRATSRGAVGSSNLTEPPLWITTVQEDISPKSAVGCTSLNSTPDNTRRYRSHPVTEVLDDISWWATTQANN